MKASFVVAAVAAASILGVSTPAIGEVSIASGGKAACVIVAQRGATDAELYAAEQLAEMLSQMTGARFELRRDADEAPANAIIVGPGPVAEKLFPGVKLNDLGREQLVMRTSGGRLLLAGGRPRGTVYAVFRFLQNECGVRWWTPWASRIPRRSNLVVRSLNVTQTPAFELRDPFWFPAFNEAWAVRNGSNTDNAKLTERVGGSISYKGFVHTFYPLVPPSENFDRHPEWYSLIDGKRTHENAQLCTTNPELRDYMVERVRQWLRETPTASIVSISQNDCMGACQCPNCKAIDDREGSHSGTMIELVNYIAQKLGPEFPNVAFDTLAYQYTRKAPKTVKPLPNVIVRLCSIECNFAAPLDDPSNAKFADDIRDWSRLTNRLYVWDYSTNFAHYVLPHPNWFALGPDVRFFHKFGVRGLFSEGAYQSSGSEMAELRAWLLAQLLWDPNQDDHKLIEEFVKGYYGDAAASPILQYMSLIHKAAKGYYLTCYSSPSAPFLRFQTLSRAEQLWKEAETAAAHDPDLVWRVRQGRLAVWYAALARWTPLRRECLQAGGVWPWPKSRKQLADEWLQVATGPGPAGWSPMTHLNEGGLTPQAFVSRFAVDPDEPVVTPKPKRRRSSGPVDIPAAERAKGVDVQDNLARIYNEPDFGEVRGDAAASDGVAVWMPCTHHEWAFQVPFSSLPAKCHAGKWKVYLVVRVEPKDGASGEATAFTAGVYDAGASVGRCQIGVAVKDASATYHSYLLGTVDANKDQYIWAAPGGEGVAKAIWIDRAYMVPVE